MPDFADRTFTSFRGAIVAAGSGRSRAKWGFARSAAAERRSKSVARHEADGAAIDDVGARPGIEVREPVGRAGDQDLAAADREAHHDGRAVACRRR